jgi:N-acetyl sugar amidotransferase
MRYCKRCLQPDSRPHIKFDDDGICFACKWQEKVDNDIDWSKRKEKLLEISEWAKKNSKGQHDCVIGVSGGKDSTFQAMYAKEELGLNCLLVNLAPDGITKWGAHNIENLIQQGFDTLKFRPNPKVWKKLIKYSFYEFGNPVKPTEYCLWACSYITAHRFGVPLIIQGENAGLTLGVVEGVGEGDDALDVNLLDTMAGGNASDWLIDDLKLNDLIWYQFPDKDELKKSNIRAIWLNYYVKNWGFTHNTDFSKKYGLIGREDHDPALTGRLSPYCSIDAESVQIVNQLLKYLKFGFGFVTDEVCYFIREGNMTREDAIKKVEKYDGKCGDKYLKEFCDYIEISKDEFWKVADQYVNKDLFKKDEVTGEWIPKFKVGIDQNTGKKEELVNS